MAQNRICGWDDEGNEKWFEGGHLPEGWHLDNPKAAKPEKKKAKKEEPKEDE